MASIRTLILEYVDGNGASHIREMHIEILREKPGTPEHTIRARLSEAVTDGILNRLGNGFYDVYAEDEGMMSVVPYPDRCSFWGDGRYRGNCDGELRIYAFRKDGEVILAVWDAGGDQVADLIEVDVPLAEAQVWTMPGARAAVKAGIDGVAVMTVGADPAYAVLKQDTVEGFVRRIRSAVVKQRPVAVEMGVPDLTTLSISIHNRLNVPHAGSIDVRVESANGVGTEAAVGLPIGVPPNGSMPLTVSLKKPLPLSGGTAEFTLRAKSWRCFPCDMDLTVEMNVEKVWRRTRPGPMCGATAETR